MEPRMDKLLHRVPLHPADDKKSFAFYSIACIIITRKEINMYTKAEKGDVVMYQDRPWVVRARRYYRDTEHSYYKLQSGRTGRGSQEAWARSDKFEVIEVR